MRSSNTDAIRVYYGDDSGRMKRYHISVSSIYPQEGEDSRWNPGETMTIGIDDYPSDDMLPHEPGVHMVKVVLPNGAESDIRSRYEART